VSRRAVVLFNLGGPDSPDAVAPFLFNLFNDPAIIRLPRFYRWLLAKWIAYRRAPLARAIYAQIGGRSPLLEQTQAQAVALAANLGDDTRVFVAMRYWHPMAAEVATEVRDFDPNEVILLPLYPQYSTTTTASSLADWRRAAAKAGLTATTRAICCYPTQPGLMAAHARLIRQALTQVPVGRRYRLLFSAHGLPRKVVKAGDPYQMQIERGVEGVLRELGITDLDWAICYQSRVGPLAWIGPSVEMEIDRAARDGVALVVDPIAFVSEHSETLVELDIEFRAMAESRGVPSYTRVPTVTTESAFIEGLADLVSQLSSRNGRLQSQAGRRTCAAEWGGCPLEGVACGANYHTAAVVVSS
jgi:ferrochelatase